MAAVIQHNVEGGFELLHLSDLHYGAKECHVESIPIITKWVLAEPNRFVVATGDLCNNGLKSSKSDVYQEVVSPGDQPKRVAELLAPIASRIVAMTTGNHERRSKKEADYDPTDIIASKLLEYTGILPPVLSDGGYVNFRWGERPNGKPWSEAFWVTHGAGGGTTEGAVANMLAKCGRMCIARGYFTGHKHLEMSYTDCIATCDLRNQKEVMLDRIFVCAPGFLKWGGYAKYGLMKPTRNGAPITTFEPDGRIYTSVGGKVL